MQAQRSSPVRIYGDSFGKTQSMFPAICRMPIEKSNDLSVNGAEMKSSDIVERRTEKSRAWTATEIRRVKGWLAMNKDIVWISRNLQRSHASIEGIAAKISAKSNLSS